MLASFLFLTLCASINSELFSHQVALIENLLSDLAASSPLRGLSVVSKDPANIEVLIKKIAALSNNPVYSEEKLEHFMLSYNFQKLIEDKIMARELYDSVRSEYRNFKQPPFILEKLKEIVFNRDFPETFVDVYEILKYSNSRKETLEYLVKSNAFIKFTDKIDNLERLISVIKQVQNSGRWHRWTPVLEHLEEKYMQLWLESALAKKNIQETELFLKFIRNPQKAQKLFQEMRGREVDPFLLKTVKKAAYHSSFDKLNTGSLVAKIISLREEGALDLLTASKDFLDHINDPLKAYYLSRRFSPESRFFADSGPEGTEFLKKLQKAASRDYSDIEDVLRSLESIDDYSMVVLDNFKPFQKYIADFKNLLLLMNKMSEHHNRLYNLFDRLPLVVKSTGSYGVFQRFALAIKTASLL